MMTRYQKTPTPKALRKALASSGYTREELDEIIERVCYCNEGLDAVMQEIDGREPIEWDPDTDETYQAYLRYYESLENA